MEKTFKPNTVVRHPDGYLGLVDAVSDIAYIVGQSFSYCYVEDSYEYALWEEVEILKPGHVQIDVSDVTIKHLESFAQHTALLWSLDEVVEDVLGRVGNAALDSWTIAEPLSLGSRITAGNSKFIRTNNEDTPWVNVDTGQSFAWGDLVRDSSETITLGW